MKKIATFLFSTLLCFNFLQAQELYDTDLVTTLELTFEQNNWNQILQDSFDLDNNGRLLATLEINGIEVFDSVGVRYRGGSTYDGNNSKNPLNIKLDHVKNQNFQGFEVLKLSNGAKDPSFLREVLSYEIGRKYMKAPRANYARVFINGAYHGLYANVESINSKFVREQFLSDDNNPRFEADPSYDFVPPSPPFGCTESQGSSLQFLGEGIICYFEHYEIQSNTGWETLRDATKILQNTPADTRSIFDLDRFIWMSIFNNLLVNLDSYLGARTNHYILFQQDNGLFAPTVDDLNESIGRYPWLTPPMTGDPQTPLNDLINLDAFYGADLNTKPMLKVLFNNPTWRRMYVAHYRTVLSEIFLNGWFEERSMELQNLINNDVITDPNAFYAATTFSDNLTQTVLDIYDNAEAYGLLELMNARVTYLQSLPEFQATPPAINDFNSSPSNPDPNSMVTITVDVSGANAVWLGVRENLKDAFELLEMFDDGNHGDGTAGDGVYGAMTTIGINGLQYYFYAENNNAGMFSPERAEVEFHSIGAGSDVVINEIMAANGSTQADPSDQFDDWVEIYNNTDQTMNLAGWYLTDDPQDLAKWSFPPGTFLDADGYLIVWIDDDELQDGLHASFKLSASGEALLLVTPNLEIKDQVVFGAQETDISFARCPNGKGAFKQIAPTFATNNNTVCMTPTNDWVNEVNFNIYPNPAGDWVQIETTFSNNFEVEIFNTIGQSVLKENSRSNEKIATQHLLPGIYFLKIENQVVKKILIQ